MNTKVTYIKESFNVISKWVSVFKSSKTEIDILAPMKTVNSKEKESTFGSTNHFTWDIFTKDLDKA